MFLTIKLCTHAKQNLKKIKLIICLKMDLALNNLQKVDMPSNPNNQPIKQVYYYYDREASPLFYLTDGVTGCKNSRNLNKARPWGTGGRLFVIRPHKFS